jgi:hypothetical protein
MNPDLYSKGTRVVPAKCASKQGIGGKVGTVISRRPVDQIVTVKWDDKHTDERWHIDLLDRR